MAATFLMWEWLVSSPHLFLQITFCTVHEKKSSTHSTAAQLGGREGPHASDETQRQQRGIYCEEISPEAQQSPLTVHAPRRHGGSCALRVHTCSTGVNPQIGQIGRTSDEHAGPDGQSSQEGAGDRVPAAVQVPGGD